MEEDTGRLPDNATRITPDLKVGDEITAYGQRFVLTAVWFDIHEEPYVTFSTPAQLMEVKRDEAASAG